MFYVFFGLSLALAASVGYNTRAALRERREASHALKLTDATQVIALSIIIKTLENHQFSNALKLNSLARLGIDNSDEVYEAEKTKQAEEIESFKTSAIKNFTEIYKEHGLTEPAFDDWRGAMRFLESNKRKAILFFKGAEL